MSHNVNKPGSDWCLVLLSRPGRSCSCRFIHAGSSIWGLLVHGRSCTRTLAALCYSHRQHSAQPWQNRAAVHSQTFLWNRPLSIAPSKTLTGYPYRHHTSQHTTHRPPLAVTYDHIKKSSPLSGSSWPCYSKCCCHGHLVQLGLGDLCRR